jgi:hypothetical protein
VGYRAKTFATYASYDGTYGYAGSATPSWVRKMLDAAENYSLTGTVPVEGLTRHWKRGVESLTGNHPFILELKNNKPDIAILGFAFNFNAEAVNIIKDYVDKGGVLFMFCDVNNGGAANVKNAGTITGMPLTYTMGSGPGAIYPFPAAGSAAPVPDDKDYIMNGLFDSLWGKSWGEDASFTSFVGGVDATKTIIYSRTEAGYNTGAVTAFRMRDKGFLFVGDGGFISRGDNVQSPTICPFYLSGKKPAVNPYYSKSHGGAYNATFFANAMHWAINYAEFHGTNKIVGNDDYSSWQESKY